MNYNEALTFYKNFLTKIPANPYKEAGEVSITAIEKQIPREVEICDWGEIYEGGLYDYRCPKCSLSVNYKDRYCPNCGQALDFYKGELEE